MAAYLLENVFESKLKRAWASAGVTGVVAVERPAADVIPPKGGTQSTVRRRCVFWMGRRHGRLGSRVKAPKFSYVRAASVDEVLRLLDEHGDEARILAGGQSLMPTLNMRLSQPRLLIDINRLESLKGISVAGDRVRIGAMTRHAEVAHSPIVARHLPLIAEAMPHVAHVAVRNRGTFGGSIALADPAAEMPACAVALGATLVVQSVRRRREIAADDYFKGLYETARRPTEILVEALIPVQRANAVSVFLELARRHGDFAIAGIASHLTFDGDFVAAARLVYFGSEDRPTLAVRAVAALTGKRLDTATRDAAAAALTHDLQPMSNPQGSAKLRLELQRVLTKRALDTALQRARAAA
jgi:aerobic carbon-monoxide dehydrogenase medium subunit